ncbi:Arginine--tRNA ligase [Lentibacillus sp. JNUCC-1]|uniref:arginine--tRNA ligase n=1 Tax=Lentibacillus sp. JNUCC-1 TaxID=2654513 RepID=UPI0012E84F53|nr:arginine--tRNA ligase [Lentibacillus sp. JNUCC-1]MUV37430.1 Arginine--tRNA ligase [Lentibacillus sp. JNUCC-1]
MNVLAQTEDTLKQAIRQAVLDAGLTDDENMPEIVLEKPKEKAHGDYATNMAMQLARIAKKPPRQIAEDIVANLGTSGASIDQVDIAGPGFINFFMKQDYLGDVVETVIEAGPDYGRTNAGGGKRVQVEFVSVNPTGDLHVAHARHAAFGDVLCNLFAAAGYDVDREYYINDAGNQIDNLARSVEARYFQAHGVEMDIPEDGYRGDDIVDIGNTLYKEYGDQWVDADPSERLAFFKSYGLKFELDKLEQDLAQFRVHFDRWFSEQSLYDDGKVEAALEKLKARNFTYEKDGAVWLKSSEFGDDKDRVLIKQDGNYTYLTPDIAYHQYKYDRGYDKVINVWGGDHHGYIPRMRAAIQALGYPVEKFDVKIIQMVNLVDKGERVKMSKRAGTAVSLRELIEVAGVDAVRYYFVMRSNESQLDFDIELARSETNENPVYYVQYAHARISTMLKQAVNKGFEANGPFDASLLTNEKETDLLTRIGMFPQVIAEAAEKGAPQRLTQYVFDLASALHSFYNAEKVLDADNPELTHARIALMKAVKQTIANALKLLGVSAPEKM